MVMLPCSPTPTSSTPSTTASTPPTTTSNSSTIRDAVNRAFPSSAKRLFPAVEESAEKIVGNLLRQYAQTLLDTEEDLQENRRRHRAKAPMSNGQLLHRVVKDPFKPVVDQEIDWKARRDAQDFMAGVMSFVTGKGITTCRADVRAVWNLTSMGVKSNAHVLLLRFGKPNLDQRCKHIQEETTLETYGVLLTWQTNWGRSEDFVGCMLDVGVAQVDLEHVCRNNASFQQYFDEFSLFVQTEAERYGFDVHATSLELNAEGSETNKVHLHAYVCRHWKHWKQAGWEQRLFRKTWWTFGDYVPDARVVSLRHKANPVRALTTGIYYVIAPKIGSVFRRSSVALWKEPRHPLC